MVFTVRSLYDRGVKIIRAQDYAGVDILATLWVQLSGFLDFSVLCTELIQALLWQRYGSRHGKVMSEVSRRRA